MKTKSIKYLIKCPTCGKTMIPDSEFINYIGYFIIRSYCTNCHSLIKARRVERKEAGRFRSLEELLEDSDYLEDLKEKKVSKK